LAELVRQKLGGLGWRREMYIHDLHASRGLKFLFYLANHQMPVRARYCASAHPILALDREFRDSDFVIEKKNERYDEAVERYLLRLMPRSLIEDFASYRLQPPAQRCRVIVTSTSFDADERFKAWVAEEVGRGSRYVVLQHGAVYGVNPFFEDTVEERTADVFVTWGWKKSHRHVPAFCLTTWGRRVRRNRLGARLCLVAFTQRPKKFLWDVEPEFEAYMAFQYRFVDGLSSSVRESLTIRLHAAHMRRLGGERQRFESRYPDVQIDEGVESLWKSLSAYRLVVFTYDSTGLLELLNVNRPVVAFWAESGFDQASGEARKHYEGLEDAGVLYRSPEGLAEFISLNWHRIDDWWASPSIQRARSEFCASYAAPATGGARELRRIILDACAKTQ
jgi:putative transferase (TIGR04331 family)